MYLILFSTSLQAQKWHQDNTQTVYAFLPLLPPPTPTPQLNSLTTKTKPQLKIHFDPPPPPPPNDLKFTGSDTIASARV